MDLGNFAVERSVSNCEFKSLNVCSFSWVVSALCEFVAVNGDVDEVAPWIVVLFVKVKFRTICDVGVDCELGFENPIVGVELMPDQSTLGSHQVGSA